MTPIRASVGAVLDDMLEGLEMSPNPSTGASGTFSPSTYPRSPPAQTCFEAAKQERYVLFLLRIFPTSLTFKSTRNYSKTLTHDVLESRGGGD